jgi:hypothetical protein
MEQHKTRCDSDRQKGAFEPDQTVDRAIHHPARPDLHGNLSYELPHRNSNGQFRDFLDDTDSDFPEPGSNPEHSGQRSVA